MPRARPDYRSHLPALPPSKTITLTKDELTRLHAICADPAFDEDVRTMAWLFRARRRAGAPTDAGVVATLRDLNRRAHALHKLLDGLSPQARKRIDEESATRGHGGEAAAPLVRQLWERLGWFTTCTYFASYSATVRHGRRGASIERQVAAEVRELFARYGARFRKSHREFVLRLVLGLPHTYRVEHHFDALRPARKK